MRLTRYQGARGGRACADTKATSLTNELAFKPSLIGYSSASLKAKEAHAVACSKREIASATYLSTKSMSFFDSFIKNVIRLAVMSRRKKTFTMQR